MNPGTILADRFTIEHKAGSGGMGSVYRCADQRSGLPVAVKVVDEATEEALERFSREQELAAQLQHPSVVKYIAHGRLGDGAGYLAMEWLDGEDLQQRLVASGLAVKDVLLVCERVADALAAAHKHGIVHRDVKPSNIFLVDGNPARVKLLDFGIARVAGTASMTRTGSAVGTPGYMSPEQIRGSRDLDGRSDLFSLGCVLFEGLTGRQAFAGENLIAIVSQMLFEPIPSILSLRPELSVELDELVSRLLNRDLALRPGDATEVAVELRRLTGRATGAGVQAKGTRLALTDAEQRVASVVVVRPPSSVVVNPQQATITVSNHAEGTLSSLMHVAQEHHAEIESLGDGTLIAVIRSSGMPTEQATEAARLALRIHAIMPGARVGVVTCRTQSNSTSHVDSLVGRAMAVLMQQQQGIVLDEVTAGLIDARFDLQPGVMPQLLREKRVDTVRTLLGKPTTCVGRERELDGLKASFLACVDDGIAQAVLVTAGPGFGKSRLRHEFLRRIDELEQPYELLLGRADSVSAGATFGMLAGALRRSAGILEGEDEQSVRHKWRERVARHVPAIEVGTTAEFLGEMIGVHFDETQSVQLFAARRDAMLMSDRMLAAWEAFLAAECKAGPVVLVLEDLHWGDLSTVKFVDAALRHLREAPFMVLALARPEVHQRFVGLWAERNLNEVRLQGLSKKAAEKLIKEALGAEVAVDQVQKLTERADGNAFYLEELVRAVAEGKGEALPESVLGMVQARLSAMEIEGRRVLKAASVFGETSWIGGIGALLGEGVEAATVADWLNELTTRELLSKRPTSVYPGESEYTFRHALVRDAAYSLLSSDDLVSAHRQAAIWLEAVGSNDVVVLAEHFDRGGHPERALPHYLRAAEQALEGNDLRGAIARAAAALRCGADGETLGKLKLIQTDAHRWLGEFSEAERRATDAAECLNEGSVLWWRAISEIVTAASRQGFYDRVADRVQRASPLEGQGEARLLQIQALASAASGLLNAGRFDVAHPLVHRVLQLSGDLAVLEPRTAAQVWRMRGSAARHAGDFETDLSSYKAACEAFKRAGDMRNAANAQVSYGFAYLEVAQFDASETQLREALSLADGLGLQTVVTRAYHNLAMVRCAKADFDTASQMEQRAIDASHKQGDSRLEAWSHVYLATIYYRKGDYAASLASARACAEMVDVAPAARAGGLAAWARASLAMDDVRTAAEVATKAMGLLEQLVELEEFEPLIRLVDAETKHRSGAVDEATQAIARARERVMQRASFIHQEDWRRSFLEQLPDNARTLQLAKKWGAP